MTEREAFEAWAKEKLGQGYSLLIEEGVYFDKVTRWAFKAWKASRQQALEEAIALMERSSKEAPNIEEHFAFADAAAAIRSLATTGDKA